MNIATRISWLTFTTFQRAASYTATILEQPFSYVETLYQFTSGYVQHYILTCSLKHIRLQLIGAILYLQITEIADPGAGPGECQFLNLLRATPGFGKATALVERVATLHASGHPSKYSNIMIVHLHPFTCCTGRLESRLTIVCTVLYLADRG